MSRNIEENVVKMRFDNSEFDTNVEQSNDTLDRFKNTLTTLPTQIYIGISNAISRINLSDIIGIGATIAGIQMIKNGIISIGDEIRNVATSALRIVNGVFSQAINQINEGGKARAMNIANAKFQIEGLKLDVETFMEAADYAVSGTAYGLDAAAKVASQLGASGVTELEELKKALRGVSGVAAMTNSSYEEIGHIFTVIASNGKLMTENIRSFSAKGLNVSANLAKALNKTEAEISEMVTHGEIDFKTFYTAMDEAFGEHAKDANKTFEGALSNIRAALSRVGEGLWTPILEHSIDVFNEIRLSINAFNKALKDVDGENSFETFGKAVKTIFGDASNIIKNIRRAIEETTFVDQLGSLFMKLSKLATYLVDVFSVDYFFIIGRVTENLASLVNILHRLVTGFQNILDEKGLRSFGGSVISLTMWISDLFDIVLQFFNENENQIWKTVGSWVDALKSAFSIITDILGINRGNFEKIFKGAVKSIFDFVKNLELTDTRLDKVSRTIRGVASAADIIKMLAVAIFNFISPIVNAIPYIVDGILTVTAYIGDAVYKLRNLIQESQVFETILGTIKSIFGAIKDLLSNVKTNFFDAFFGENSGDRSFLQKLKDFLKNLGTDISDAVSKLDFKGIDLSGLQEFIYNLANFGLGSDTLGDSESNMTVLERVLNSVKELFGYIGEFFKNNVVTIFTGENETVNKLFEKIGNFFKKFGTSIKDTFDAIADFSNNVDIPYPVIIAGAALLWHAMDIVRDIIVEVIKAIVQLAEIVSHDLEGKEIVMAILHKVIDKFFSDKTASLFDRIGQFFGFIKELDLPSIFHGQSEPEEAVIIRSIGEMLKGFAWAFISIAAALFIIALIPTDKLMDAVKILEEFVLAITIIAGVFFLLQKILPNFANGVISIRGIAASVFPSSATNPMTAIGYAFKNIALAILAIAASVYIISKVDPGRLDAATTTMISALSVVSGFLILITVIGSQMEDGASILNAIGVAMLKMSVGMFLIGLAIAAISITFKAGEESKLLAIGSVFAVLIFVMGLIITMIYSVDTSAARAFAQGTAIFFMMAGMVGVILTLAAAIVVLSFIPEDKLTAASIAIGILIGVVAGAIILIGLVISGLSEGPQALATIGILLILFQGLFTNLLAIAAIVGAVALTVYQITSLVKAIGDIIKALSDMDTDKAARVASNFKTIMKGLGEGIAIGVVSMFTEMTKQIGKAFPLLFEFIIKELLPFLDNLFGTVIPTLTKNTLNAVVAILNALIEFLPTALYMLSDILFGNTGSGILEIIRDGIDTIWDDTVSWLKERIPIWVPDLLLLMLILITAINDAFEEKWEDFDKEIQRLIDNTIDFVGKLLTGEKTMNDIGNLIGDIFDRIVEVVGNNEDRIKEAFAEIGRMMGSSLLEGIAEMLDENGFDGIADLVYKGADNIRGEDLDVSPIQSSGHNARAALSGSSSDFSSGNDFSFMSALGTAGDLLSSSIFNRKDNKESTSSNVTGNVKITLDGSPNMKHYFDDLNAYKILQVFSGSSIGE